jgi:23S rRNA (guanosine2251-2'-O)-methyltransferase
MARHSFRRRRGDDAASPDVVYGSNPVLEALRAGPDAIGTVWVARGVHLADRVLAEARRAGIAVELVERDVLDGLTGGGHHQGVAARVRPVAFLALDDLIRAALGLIVVLDGLTDPQNVGAIIRSAEVLGGGGLVLPKDRAPHLTPAVVRASSGAAFHLPIAQVVNVARSLEQLKSAGYWIVGLDADGPSRFRDLPALERVVLVVGAEGKGIRPLVAEACDFRVSIPVRGRVASLNAAAAASIGIYELAGQIARLRDPSGG